MNLALSNNSFLRVPTSLNCYKDKKLKMIIIVVVAAAALVVVIKK